MHGLIGAECVLSETSLARREGGVMFHMPSLYRCDVIIIVVQVKKDASFRKSYDLASLNRVIKVHF